MGQQRGVEATRYRCCVFFSYVDRDRLRTCYVIISHLTNADSFYFIFIMLSSLFNLLFFLLCGTCQNISSAIQF